MKIGRMWMLIGLGNIYVGCKAITGGGASMGYEFVSDWASYLLVATGVACLVASFRISKRS
jgi:hypothetical protein